MDGNPIEIQVMNLLAADSELMAILATADDGNKALYIANGSDKNVRYPALIMECIDLISEEKLPAGFAQLRFHCFFAIDDSGPYSKWVVIRELLENRFARNRDEPLTDIDFYSNIGTRVVAINRTKADYGFDEMEDKYHGQLFYDIVKSENEDFSKDYSSWCPEPIVIGSPSVSIMPVPSPS